MVLSKCLGYSIVAGAVMVKLPQILKITNAKSGEGISFLSVLFELLAISANVSYSYASGFPFSSYGEGVFLSIQTSLVMFLVIYFGGSFLGSFLFLMTYGATMAYLLSPACSLKLLAAIQGVNIVIVILSKLIQVHSNYSNSSTGQLSAVTVGLIWWGSIVRIFTSIQETGDQLIVITYMAAAICNSLLVGQMWYYWNKKSKTA